ncbi:MAG: ComEC/Rec2 family competence protein [Clostridia bacterium]|nr:ComEC/Rec2 family competence protein [Clostridia bacterium]
MDNTLHYAEIEVYSVNYESDDTVYFNGTVKELDKEKSNFKCKFSYYCDESEKTEICKGDVISAAIKFCKFEKTASFDEEKYCKSLGIYNNAYIDTDYPVTVLYTQNYPVKNAFEMIRGICRDLFLRYTSDISEPLLVSLVTGDTSELSDSVKRDFSRLGISHMLAVSGMHLSVIMSLFGAFSDSFDISRRNKSLFVILVCSFYIILAGMSASILRSGVMFILMNSAFFFKRESDSITSLFAAVALIVLVSPSAIYDIGLILSFCATFGIVLILPGFQKRIFNKTGLRGKFLKIIVLPIFTTLAALTFSLVPLLLYFDEYPLLSVLANLLFCPFITAILTLIPIFLIFGWLWPVAFGIGAVLDILTRALLFLVELVAGFEKLTLSTAYPFVLLTLVLYICIMLSAFIFNKRRLFLVSYLIWFCVFIISSAVYGFFVDDFSCVYSVYKSNDSIVLRDKRTAVYFEFGNNTKGSANESFTRMNDSLYSTELDAWVVGAYSENLCATMQKYLQNKYIKTVFLPVPENDVDQVMAEDIIYYADKECCDTEFFKYGEAFDVCGFSVFIAYPEGYCQKNVYSAYISSDNRKIAYYSLGYFDYSSSIYDADTVFMGSNGTRKKLQNYPIFDCDTLVISEKNSSFAENIKDNKRVLLNENSNFYIE